jgi:hypothetical protein
MDGLFGFLGAFIGGAAASLISWFLIDKQHRHAKELQDRQFTQSERDHELEQRHTRGNLIAEWENARIDRKAEWDQQREEREQQRELDRQREYERAQLEAIRQLELVLPSFSRAARTLYEARQERYAAAQSGRELPEWQPDLEEYVAQFNDLRYVAMGSITKIGNEKLRRRAGHLYQLDESMALSDPFVWTPGRETFGGHDPVVLQVNWQEQLLSMSGRLYRGESIEGEFVEESMHSPDPRRSA